ncbi:MAG: hypothetical protein K8R67_04980, partial [Desulfobacteraceae bacterium]|nr:hypothetical protein [Desulfobacteraceae bacterium]
NKFTKIAVSFLLLVLAIVKWVFYDVANPRMDNVFLCLIAFAILVYFIPWENLKSFKVAGIELSLEQSPIKAAISGLGLSRINDKQLKEKLNKLDNEIQSIRGGRVLWIDDKPHNITGERRLLRALGIQVVTSISSDSAESILESDNDYDLIISDIQRIGNSYKLNNGKPIHEGTNFIVKLRQMEDPNIRAMPVVFYAAYPWDSLVEFSRPAREIQPEPELCNSVIDFIPKVVKQLAQSRMTPIVYSKTKAPTSARWNKKVS